ncbi:MAG TPA: endonuclease III [Symbiobacteriaceae bacterium]|nr:endonuclease III [Symbiobacteriaceae bacterium]
MAAKRVPVAEILERLSHMYPDAKCALDHSSAFELLIATVLSAQCTDARVNIVTARIFPTHNRPEHFAALTPHDIGEMIRDCGLWQSKAKNIHQTCRILLDKHRGEVPATMEELIELPGVGRKTANVVLSNAFGVPAIAVDTHVLRVSNRLGLAEANTPEKTEEQLMRRIPRDLWSSAHHWIIHHGRQVCDARKPRCSECPLLAFCKFGKSAVSGSKPKEMAAAAKPREAKPTRQAKSGKPSGTGKKAGQDL